MTEETYRPSEANGPDGLRNNEEQLQQIQNRTDEFALSKEERDKRDEGGVEDPFDADNVGAFTLITLMRLYDVQMALLREQNQDVGDALHEIHNAGKLLGSFPWLNVEEE